jgi:hypothetical protein
MKIFLVLLHNLLKFVVFQKNILIYMKFEALSAKKFNTSENENINKLVGGNTTSSTSSTYSNRRFDSRADSDSSGNGSSTASTSNVNGVITYDM